MRTKLVLALLLALAVVLALGPRLTFGAVAAIASPSGYRVTITGQETAWYKLYPDKIEMVLAGQNSAQKIVDFQIMYQNEVDEMCGANGVNYCFKPEFGKAVVYLSNGPKLDARYAQPLTHTISHVIADVVLYYNGEVLSPKLKADQIGYPSDVKARMISDKIVGSWVFLGEFRYSGQTDPRPWH